VAPTRKATVERWDATDRRIRIAAGPPSFLEVHENFNRGWRASLGGHRLEPVQLEGWQEGFALPPGRGGIVTLRFAPERSFRAGLVLGLLCAFILAVLAALPVARGRRRDQTYAPREVTKSRSTRHWPRWVAAALAITSVGLVSVPALAVVPVALVLSRFDGRLPACAAALGMAAAGIVSAISIDAFPGAHVGAFGAPSQVLATGALGMVLLAGCVRPRKVRLRAP